MTMSSLDAAEAAPDALLGREHECLAIEDVLDAARAQHSGVLMLHGDAGVGKTALLEYARRSAGDMLVVGGAGCEAEVELGFAALHQLTRPVHDRIDRLPGPQARALRVAFGLESCGKRDRFLASVALLTLLGVAAADRPLLCAVDDAQWLDRPSADALTFAARRLAADHVALVVASRDPPRVNLPALCVHGLPDEAARALVLSRGTERVAPAVLERIVRAAGPHAAAGRRRRGFSTLAGVAIAVILATGVIQAVISTDSFSELLDAAYGRAVLIKFVLFVVIVALGWVNRSRPAPRRGRRSDAGRCRRSSAANAARRTPGRHRGAGRDRRTRRLCAGQGGLLGAVLHRQGPRAGAARGHRRPRPRRPQRHAPLP